MLVDVEYPRPGPEGETNDQWLVCQTAHGLTYKVASANKTWIKENFSYKNKFKSGETELVFGSDAVLDLSTNEIRSNSPPGLRKKINDGGNGTNGTVDYGNGKRQLAVTTGDKSILVVRVVATDAAPTDSESRLGDSVFGTDGDLVTLKSQYNACSHGTLNIIPATDKDGKDGGKNVLIRNGSVTVSVAVNTSVGDIAMSNEVTTRLESIFGTSANNLADHVMYCLPPGTMDEKQRVAYGYYNSWLTFYSDEWCTYLR